jgi:predicted transcriptional regulator
MRAGVENLTAKGKAKIAKELRAADWKIRAIADELGVEEWAVCQYLRWNGTGPVYAQAKGRARRPA